MPSCLCSLASVRQTSRMCVGDVGAGDPGLLAVDHVAAVARARPGTAASRRRSRPRARTSRSPRPGRRRSPPRISCFCSSVPKRSYAPATISVTPCRPIGSRPRVVSSSSRHRSTSAAARAAVLLGDRDAEPAELGDLLVELLVVLLGALVRERVALLARPALARGEVADRLDEGLLLVGQGERARNRGCGRHAGDRSEKTGWPASRWRLSGFARGPMERVRICPPAERAMSAPRAIGRACARSVLPGAVPSLPCSPSPRSQRRAARRPVRGDRRALVPLRPRASSPPCAASRTAASTGTRRSGARRSTTGSPSTSPTCSTRFPELTPSDEVAEWLRAIERALGRQRLDARATTGAAGGRCTTRAGTRPDRAARRARSSATGARSCR